MKRKATIIILTAILIISFHDAIYSQEFYRFHPDRNVVMASSGLNMRSKPNTTSTKLVNIPYGEKVHILHKDHYGLDTIYTIKTALADHAVYGFWQKVQYNEYVGYVHNAFLRMHYRFKNNLVEETNKEFVYLQPGYDCADEFYNTNEYFWYGYYQETSADGTTINKPYRKLIDISFINVADEMTGSGTIVKEDLYLKFIIGSKKVLPETDMESILEKQLYQRTDNTTFKLDSTIMRQGNITMKNKVDPEDASEYQSFYLQENKKRQLINTRTANYHIFLNPTFIQADLDGDGLLDYIFDHGDDGYSRGLYLSSEANVLEVAKLVSIYQRGPCC